MAEFYSEFWECIDADKAVADLDRVDAKRKQVDSNLDQTNLKSEWTFHKARQVVMASFNVLTNFLEIAGISIPRTVQALVSGALSVGTALYTIATAEAVTPYMQAAAVITAISAAASIGAAFTAEAEGKKIANNINQTIHGINMLVGAFR